MARGSEGERFRRVFILLLAAAISAAFLVTIRGFWVALLFAAIFTGIFRPLHQRLAARLGGRESVAAAVTLVIVLVGIIVPLSGFLGIVTAQALQVSEAARPWLEARLEAGGGGEALLGQLRLPGLLEPYQEQLVSRAGQLAGGIGRFLVDALAAATRGTVQFLLLLFIMLYAMFFFLRDGDALVQRVASLVPLSAQETQLMAHRFRSVTRATLKGTLVIAMLQGLLAGLGFAVAGIGAAAFWGTVMGFLSLIPGVGTALVWIPAVVFLIATGHVLAGVALGVWCAAVVGTVDNLLRPLLVGRDTEMSDLLIFLSTLGGLVVFGAPGLVIGPLVAALFVTVWEIYGLEFQAVLPGRAGPAAPDRA